jgi:predicted permease
MTEAEAREATMRRFGSYTLVHDECEALGREREARHRRAERRHALRQDVRFGARTLLANRGFALGVALTLALGIGATAAVFSVAYGVLLRPLPYRDADALVRLWSKNMGRGVEFFSVSPADFGEWRGARDAFSAMAAFERQREVTLARAGAASGAGDRPEGVAAAAVMPELFPLLGTAAARGRALRPDDARPDAPAVAVVDDALWRGRFGADPALVGSDLLLDGRRVTVVGVMPPRFVVPGTPAQVWTPLSLAGASDDPSNRYLRVLARLAPGVTREAALARLEVVAARLARERTKTNAGWSISMMSIPEAVVGRQFRRALLVLLGVVGVVLLIACANAASLQLARATARRREIALRTALGATRWRLVRQLVTESALLAAVGGAAGLALAWAGVAALRKVGDTTVPRLEDVRLDLPVLAFTVLAAVGSALLFGLAPALHASRADAGTALKEGGRGTGDGAVGGGGGGGGARAALVVAQVALSLVLLVGAGLLMRSFLRLQRVDLGFDPRGVTVVPLRAPAGAEEVPERMARFHEAVLAEVQRLPGVTAAAVSSPPFGGPNAGLRYLRTDRALPAGEPAPDADYRVVTPGYFHTLGIHLVRGRDVTAQDRADAPRVALVSETLARSAWPGEDPVGRQVRLGGTIDGPVVTIVGVVADARYVSLESPEVRPMMYFAAAARPQRVMSLVVRGGGDQGALAAAVRRAVAALDPSLPAPTVRPMEELVGEATTTARFATTLFGVFAATALALALVGIYGVTSYLVRLRTHELGIRAALGASPRWLASTVVVRATRLTLAGVVLGLVAAAWLSRWLGALLFETRPTEPGVYAAIALVLLAVAAGASLLPARRASRADPLVALREG